jgi:hypothetical protein
LDGFVKKGKTGFKVGENPEWNNSDTTERIDSTPQKLNINVKGNVRHHFRSSSESSHNFLIDLATSWSERDKGGSGSAH